MMTSSPNSSHRRVLHPIPLGGGALVDKLCDQLQRNAVTVWLDREEIRPGERWQLAIRRAIERRAFFIACFSEAYGSRAASYMNLELTLATEQLLMRPTDRAWFIPVLFDGGTVPDRSIGGGETLRDLQWVDLSDNWDSGVQRLLRVLQPPPFEAVVMMTDLIGYPAWAERNNLSKIGEVMSALYTAQRAATLAHGGILDHAHGDGIIAIFEHTSNALACALTIRDDAASSDALDEIGVRIGLAAGQIIRSRHFAIGDTFNVAARVCSQAKSGQVLATNSVAELDCGPDVTLTELEPTVITPNSPPVSRL